MLNQLQRGDEPALLPCRRSGFLRRPYMALARVGRSFQVFEDFLYVFRGRDGSRRTSALLNP
jgi:hypothetical protein